MISIQIEPNLADAQEGHRIVAALQALYGMEDSTSLRVPSSAAERVKSLPTQPVPPAPPAPPIPATPQVPAVPPIPAAPPAPPAAAAAQQQTVPVDASAFSVPAVPTPPAPPAPAPAVPSAPANTGNPAGVDELDTRGLPWDARIHASTKAKNADGTWRQMRGVETKSPGLVTAVEAELRVIYPDLQVASTLAGAFPTPPVPPVPAPPAIPVPPIPAVPQVPAVPAPPVPPVPPIPGGVVKPTTFMGMLEKIRQLVEESGLISQEEVEAACQAVGVPGLLHLGAIATVDATVISRLDAEIERVLAS